VFLYKFHEEEMFEAIFYKKKLIFKQIIPNAELKNITHERV